MKRPNRGKGFEARILQGFKKYSKEISSDRFHDPQAGYAGVRTFCDFVAYMKPYLFYLECKSITENSINFNSGITANQWLGLEEKSGCSGVISGFIVWFIDYRLTVYVSVKEMLRLRATGVKALNIKHLRNNDVAWVSIPGIQKQIYMDYDMLTGLQSIVKLYETNEKETQNGNV